MRGGTTRSPAVNQAPPNQQVRALLRDTDRVPKLNTRVRVPPAARQRKPRSDRVLDTAGGPPGCSLRAWERSSFLARSPRATDRVLDALCHVQQQGLFTPWSEELQTDRQPRLMQSDRNG